VNPDGTKVLNGRSLDVKMVKQRCNNIALTLWTKLPKKQSVGQSIECRINKNALLQTLFLAILPTGNVLCLDDQYIYTRCIVALREH